MFTLVFLLNLFSISSLLSGCLNIQNSVICFSSNLLCVVSVINFVEVVVVVEDVLGVQKSTSDETSDYSGNYRNQ